MKQIVLFFLIVFSLQVSAQNSSNRGTEFWVGYGHNTLFSNLAGIGANSQNLVLYLGADQAATVTVSVNGTTYSQTYNIAANSVIETAPLPKVFPDDARLTGEGLFNTGIHIVSDVPIVAYAHQYGNNSSGATMLLPVETYGYTYYSLNFTQETNATPAYSWFYVVASENNTAVEITPAVVTQGGRPANVPFTVNLSKGQIYNVFGSSTGTTGLDVTGSKVKSVAGSDGKCHPIGVFSGSSRIVICGTSGDILQQQIFPSSAWGTSYLTYPSVNSFNVGSTNSNYYRIAVRDPTTKVYKNGGLLSGLNNNFYYQYKSNTADFITADKPVLVSQLIPSMQNSCGVYEGDGDPEMFFLSPLEQSIDKASFYSTNNQNITDNYVVIIVKKTGAASLTVDGSSFFDYSVPHQNNGQYQVLVKSLVGGVQHTIVSDSTFNAITYGFSTYESYGYNAGTYINNLDLIPSLKNTYSLTRTNPFTCPKTPFNISINIAYRPSKIVWSFSKVSNFLPTSDTTLTNPLPIDSSFINGRRYYRYNLPRNYYFTDTGKYKIPLTITAAEIDNCNNELDLFYPVDVIKGPMPDFKEIYSSCKEDTARIGFIGSPGYAIFKWKWEFDDGTIDSAIHPLKVFSTDGTHPVKVSITASNGCLGDTIKSIRTNPKPISTFGVAPLPACEGSILKFTDTSSFGGILKSWYWDFGNGKVLNEPSNFPQFATYPNPGFYTIAHFAKSNGTCKSDTIKKVIQIFAKPEADFKAVMGCLPDSTVRFTDSTKVLDGQALNYSWNFGDPNATIANPNTSILQNPVHKYKVPGTYSVRMIVVTANGCADTIIKSVVVFPKPAIAFAINNINQCLGSNNFIFTNTSTVGGGTLSYLWSFGDNKTSTLQNPNHIYTAGGTYSVKLIITSVLGCKDSLSETVTVYPGPQASFTINTPAQCIGNGFVFTNTSTITTGPVTYAWTLGDGNTSTNQVVNHSYAAAGIYNVKLVVTAANGCKDSITKPVTVYPKPVATFNVTNPNSCSITNTISFTNTSTVASGTITHAWNFGDGGTSTLQNPTHTYTAPGNYTITLIVTSNQGCKDTSVRSITFNSKPLVSFTINNPSQCARGNSFSFINTSTILSGTMSYKWTFGEGGTSTLQNPNYSYSTPGTYTVKLIATSNNGCIDSATKTVTVNPDPTVSFNIINPAQCIKGNVFTFTNTSTAGSGTMQHEWTFGDATNSTTVSPAHTYAAAGNYLVKLVVTTNKGCKDSITKNVIVNPTPVPAFTINDSAQCLSGNNFAFTNSSTISTGTVSYNWYFGDGNNSSLTSPSHVYVTAGTYKVKLVVTSSTGCKDSITKTIIVYRQPIAGFLVNNTACVNSPLSFTNASSPLTTVNFLWSFGDGNNSTLQNPSNSYAVSGSYNVQLIVASSDGCKDSITKVAVVQPQPAASFSVNSSSQCLVNNSFSFANTSTISAGSLTSYNWNFGNGATSSLQNPVYSYAAAGAYTVTLIVTSNNSCKDTSTQTVTVFPKPVSAFSVNSVRQCLTGNSFAFTNSSTVSSGTISYLWEFGDAATSSLQNPSHSYSTPGTYTVLLITTSNNGCKDSVSKTVTVAPKPSVAFTVNSGAQCLRGNSFSFTNTSTVSTGTIAYNWTFGDGGTSTVQNPVHSYATSGSYQVKLIVTTNIGCKDSLTQTVTVIQKPVAAFTTNTPTQCVNGNSFSFANNSTSSVGALTYSWQFGDATTSTQASPTHVYAAAGNYTVQLIATSANGCTDTISHSVAVNPKPAVSFSINNGLQCVAANSFSFTNTSSIAPGSLTYSWDFGDGNSSTLTNATHSYAMAGAYNVKLVATSNNGCKDSSIQTVTVIQKPTASFVINNPASCLSGNAFTFTSNSTAPSGSLTYAWTFGDGGISPVQNPSHSYAAAGTYTVQLIVTSTNGCKDTATKTVTVHPQPVASFTVNDSAQCFVNNSFSFISTSASSGATNYSWDFGDATTANTASATHTYAASGSYTIKLLVRSGSGCVDSIYKTITVYPSPTASFNVNNSTQCLNGNSYTFTNTSNISAGTLLFNWNFGDGNTSSGISPTYIYTASGNYTVHLLVTTGDGCKDSTTKPITVLPKPTASFTVNLSNQCLVGNKYSFNNTSTIPGTATYLWNFGDGSYSTTASPSYNYTVAGTYVVKLLITASNGCKDSITQTVTVYPKLTAAFAVNKVTQCLNGNSFSFSNNSTIPVGSFTSAWTFGDGGTSNSISPAYTYTTPGTYTVKLVITSTNGCKDSSTKNVIVSPQPAASFTINSVNQCFANHNFSFTNTSVTIGSTTYLWSFGDAGTSTTFNASHKYTAPGTYTVKLIATTASGCKDSLSKTIMVYPKPIVAFTINTAAQCLSGNNYSFTNTSSVTPGTLTYLWSFGDGNTSSTASPTYNYTTAGTYTVKLVVTTNNGCKDSLSKNIVVYPKPISAFTINNDKQCLNGNNFVFTNNTTTTVATSYLWTFGDATTSTLASPSHKYANAGVYQVKLVATNINGCKDSVVSSVTVYAKPTAAFAINNSNQCIEINNYSFTNNSTIAGSFTSLWTFGDGNISTATSPTHVYTTSGNYIVKLVVSSVNGCKDSMSQNITVYPKPTAAFTVNDSSQCLNINKFSFTNTSVAAATASHKWTFGDATTSTLLSPSHVYSTQGNFFVKLLVVTATGCRDSVTKPLIVYPNAVARFTITDSAQCIGGNNFIFTNNSTAAAPMSSLWNLGDAMQATTLNTTHSYTIAGGYKVKLLVTSKDGCQDSITKAVIVFPKPTASFTINNSNQCLNSNSYSFTNTSTGSAFTSEWRFGDGKTLNGTNATHTYASSGTYTVTLIVTTAAGCKDTATRTINIYPEPKAFFNVAGVGLCVNNNIYTFTNTSTISIGTLTYDWNFGDATTSTETSPVHSYSTAGVFTVRLIVTSQDGCKDTVSQKITVNSKPRAAFTVDLPKQCVNTNNFIFKNNSSTGALINYSWTLGDGSTSTALSPNHTYAQDGTYIVTLVAFNAFSCSDTATQQVVVYPKPSPSFLVNNSTQCLQGNQFIITNTSSISSGNLSYSWNFGDNNTSTSANPTHSYLKDTVYSITQVATSNFGCVDTARQNVIVVPNPKAAFTINNSNQCLKGNQFIFANQSTAPAGVSYHWQFGDGTMSNQKNPVKAYANAAIYKVTLYISEGNGCKSDTATTALTVFPQPIVSAGPDLLVQQGKAVLLQPRVSGNNVSYLWSPATWLSSTSVLAPLTAPSANIKYTLTVTSANGCTESDDVNVKLLKPLNIPNAFSPNGDGINDTWVIRSLADYPGCTVEVFNRYGAPVFRSTGYSKPWDGTTNGNKLPVGTYYYIVDPKNGLEKVGGNVSIIR